MRSGLLVCAFAFIWSAAASGADNTEAKVPLSAEARKRQYASLQKELEASRPEENPTREQIVAYLELAVERSGKFARENPQTPEGFEAASFLAELLSQVNHPDAQKFARLAVEVAPAAGVDVKRVAFCWAMVANAQLQEGKAGEARKSLEKIKPLFKEMYEELSSQFDALEKQMAADKEALENLQPGKKAAFECKDIKGAAVSMAALRGKVVLIDFWAPWCGPCMEEMPSLVKLVKDKRARGFEAVGVSLDKDADELTQTIADHEITWPVVSDHKGWQSELARKWAVRSIPMTYLIDRKGIIRHVNLRGKELADAVEKLLEEKP